MGLGKPSMYSDSLRVGRSGDRIPVGERFSTAVQISPGAHPASYTVGTWSFSGVKRPGRGVDHPPPSSAEIEGRVELYIYSPSGSSWPVLGRTLPLPLPLPLRQNHSFTHDHLSYEDFLKLLKLHTLHDRGLHLMLYFLCLFIEVYNISPLFWILLLFQFLIVILENPLFSVLLATTLHLLDVFRQLTACTVGGLRKPITSLKKILQYCDICISIYLCFFMA